MSIHQLDIYGKDKVETAITRLKTFEPPEGYFLAFSGGKDSVVVKALADMAEVKYDAHYSVTSADPPELVQFVKTFDDVSFDRPLDKDGNQITMWNLIPKKKMPPTRIVRCCCKELKEAAGEGRFTITGVRWEESAKRKHRGGLELAKKKSHRMENFDPDNPSQEMIHICPDHARRHLNPIIDWSTEEVWEFIREYNVPYCKLYDEGYKRLGCIGCPMGTIAHRKAEFEKYPKYKQAYIRAFDRMLKNMGGRCAKRERQKKCSNGGNNDTTGAIRLLDEMRIAWTNGNEVMEWWIK